MTRISLEDADTVAVAGSPSLGPQVIQRLAWRLEGPRVDLLVEQREAVTRRLRGEAGLLLGWQPQTPEDGLRAARAKATYLIASSPINETEGQGNHEHVWSFSVPSYRQLLEGAGWIPVAYQELRFYPPFYDFQLWVCR